MRYAPKHKEDTRARLVRATGALAKRQGFSGTGIDGLSSKGNDAFEDNPPDIVITVCDKAAAEACPVYFGPAIKAHWGLADPSEVKGDEATVAAAFHATLAHIETRCRAFLALPFARLEPAALKRELDRISTL